ncbi:MAG: quinolinate synthase NadA [Nitrospirae bacterium]|nr:quinolinate synthase NadA [Nitrospirota bacterium]
MDKLVDEINKLKREKNAIVLAHSYQRPEIYDVADFIGDSLQLCQEAAKTDAGLIVFCGVHFMAESACLLNPGKKVIVPHVDAGCAMADMVEAEDLRNFKAKHPGAVVVCYVNSSAEVKAESDVCCTSANAAKVVSQMDADEIIFVPDKNLAAYVQTQVPGKKIIPWKGFCPVHHTLTKQYIEGVREAHPEAKIIAHPECRPEVLMLADHVCSTTGMIEAARRDPAEEFFILTECGMTERLNRELPEKKFYGLCNMCFDMKKNTLESVLGCLIDEKEEVRVEKSVADKARSALDKMLELS